MATPRKYATLAEFEELKALVEKMQQNPAPSEEHTCYVLASETSAGLGVPDANGVPVTIGCWVQWIGYDGSLTSPAERVYKMEIKEASGSTGKATIVVYAGKRNCAEDSGAKPCVNGILRNHAVVEVSAPKKKATA